MNINNFTQLVETPAVSVFDRSCPKRFPMKIGPLYPACWELLSFGNSVKCTSAHKMRLMPLVAPAFADLRVQEHSAVVPLRVIMQDYESKFNYAENREGASLPHFTLEQYNALLLAMARANLSPIGSLLDFFGLPVYGDLYKCIDFDSAIMFASSDGSNKVSVFTSLSVNQYTEIFITNSNYSWPTELELIYRNNDFGVFHFMPFACYLAYKKFNLDLSSNIGVDAIEHLYSFIPSYSDLNGVVARGNFVPTDDELIQASSFSTMKEAVSSYKNFLYSLVLRSYFENYLSGDLDTSFTTLPFRAYWRFHYDWNVNGNFVDREVMLQKNVYDFEETVLSAAHTVNFGTTDDPDYQPAVETLKYLLFPVNRLWDDDFFTSLLPTSAVDNAVEIPANSTVLDLAKLTAWQKFVFKLSYSNRYRDTVWNVFKIKPSDARLQQSYPIKQFTHDVQVGEITQTSASEVSGLLGSFAGRGYSSGLNKGYHIFAEEPCIIFDFISFVPRSIYADSLHPLVHVDDILDFPLPDMDVLGNQPIFSDLVSGNPADSTTVLGFGRQYQEWLQSYGQVHGEFKTSLDYWVLTRRFSDTPVINDDFLRIHPADDLDVIFAEQNGDHAMLDIYYKRSVTRHVHRNVRIKI